MSEIGNLVESLENRFKKLIQKMDSLQQTNQELMTKLSNSEKNNASQNQEIIQLKSNFESIKITNSLLGSDDYKRDTKLKINSLIREIDYCIAQLSD
jgi:cell division septum initiation protein DivIVA